MIVVATGCPASVGPELSLKAATEVLHVPIVLVGDEATLRAAAELVSVRDDRLLTLGRSAPKAPGIYLLKAGPALGMADRNPGKPTKTSGLAQLRYVEEAFAFAKKHRAPLVTAAVSKAAIAHSGDRAAKKFRGHTEWLQALDGAAPVTMCFWSTRLTTSLVTTHLPVKSVPRALSAEGVLRATLHLAELLFATGKSKPRLAVCSLNPHAGESELLGTEERHAILPGIAEASRRLRGKAEVVGPVGAETAYRLAAAGQYDGVVAMYHDQATIPMKLLAFGDAVNVTLGLSIIRTSVDHGTAYDIAWKNIADVEGMRAAVQLAVRLSEKPRRRG
ncbi:MAG: 4-hydroxythreonine-4-phosphate dehydrogenase [Pseudomonadota bacterium]|jgi:4-hydroxythreonine-4-phosphate dehydrogenase